MVFATLESLENDEIDCGKCLSKRTDDFRQAKGCKSIVKHNVYQSDNFIFHRCPGNFVRYEVKSFINTYNRMQNGILPFEGGYFDQPNKIVEILNLIDGYYQDKQAKENATEKRKRKIMKRG